MAGRFVVPALQRLGFEVRGQYSKQPGQTPGVEWRQMNFLESLDFNALVEGCDAVVHLAAELANVSRMSRVNVDAAFRHVSLSPVPLNVPYIPDVPELQSQCCSHSNRMS